MAKLHDLDVDDYLADCVRIEPTALDEEFTRTAADQAYWNERHARAARAYMQAKLNRERTAARLHIELRESLMLEAKAAADNAAAVAKAADPKAKTDVRVKPPTVGDIEAAVMECADMVAVREAELDAEIEVERLRGVLQAVRTKRDMLIQLGANVRTEMEGDLALRNRMDGERRSKLDP